MVIFTARAVCEMRTTGQHVEMKRISAKTLICVLVFLCIPHLFAGSASAHRVIIFAWVEGDTVLVESKFSGGKKVTAGKIRVVDPQGKALESGLTNDQGEFSFKVPKRTDLKIVLNAGQGHQAEWIVPESELTDPTVKTDAGNGTEVLMHGKPAAPVPRKTTDTEPVETDPAMDPEELEAIIENVLDRKLKPIVRMLADTRQQGPAVKDILGGIGYILGLAGIAAYVQSRKKKG